MIQRYLKRRTTKVNPDGKAERSKLAINAFMFNMEKQNMCF